MKLLLPLALVALVATACPQEQQRVIETGRDRGAALQVDTALTSLGVAQETYLSMTGSYASDVATLHSEAGLRFAEGVTLTIKRAGPEGYCAEASHPDAGVRHFASEKGAPAPGPC